MEDKNSFVSIEIGKNQLELRGSEDFVKERLEHLLDRFDFQNEAYKQEFTENEDTETPQSDLGAISDSDLKSLIGNLKISAEDFHENFSIDGEKPFILQPDEVPGSSDTEILMNASLALCYIWEVYYGEERVKTTELKTAIMDSDLSYDSFANRTKAKGYQKYFQSKGRGPSATVSLRQPGIREARNVIRGMVED